MAPSTTSCTVLILHDSHGPQIEELASAVARGVQRVEGARAVKVRDAEALRQDLLSAYALVLGSPSWSGITGSLKLWLDDQGDLWEERALEGKIGAAFTTGRGRHSGLEFTLLSLIHWMLACGMVIAGLPWSDRMRVSGSYYGATATSQVSPEDLEQAQDLGERVARLATDLALGRVDRLGR